MKKLLLASLAAVTTIPAGYWPEQRTDEILAKVETIRLAPDLSTLSANEQAALRDLLEVGRIFQDLYEDAGHHQALQSREALKLLDDRAGHPKQTQNLLQLYRLWHGPIVTTLDNKREPMLPADPQVPGRNVYPIDSTKAEIEAFLAKHPEQRASILHERTVVRRATKENLDRDLAVLSQYPAIEVLHPNLQHDLKKLARTPDRNVFYAVPYPVAWAEPMMKAYRRLRSAADLLQSSDAEFAGYVRNRARDLLANDSRAATPRG